MNLSRRAWCWLMAMGAQASVGARRASAQDARGAANAQAEDDDAVRRGRKLVFPRDHGAHAAQRIEWWYVTGWLGAARSKPASDAQPTHGFQITFFRLRTGLAQGMTSRFAARHLLMAHAAVSDLAAARHRHGERLARWSGDDDASLRSRASFGDGHVQIGAWQLARGGDAAASTWAAKVDAGEWSLDAQLRASRPPLLQGDAGFSRKGPLESHATHYVTEPQLATRARLTLGARVLDLEGVAWLDHEWSDLLMPDDAVGWDWIGMNLDDGSALTAFRVRSAEGSAVWAGGSHRDGAGKLRVFEPQETSFAPGRTWRSPATNGVYPMQWSITCPAGRFEIRSLLDAQELDARASTGTVYWEGLSSLHDEQGKRIGWGYLEMTGYAARLKL